MSSRAAVPLMPLFVMLAALPRVHAQRPVESSEPKLLSVFPAAAQRGAKVNVEIRGQHLEGAHSVWLQEPGWTARLLKLEEATEQIREKLNPFEKDPKKPALVYSALVELDLPAEARPGTRRLRLVSPRGISNAIRFRVEPQPVILEGPGARQLAAKAQRLGVPALVAGKLSRSGELDYYSFEAEAGEELSFEITLAEGMDPRLALYRSGASWLNPERTARMLLEEERTSDLMPVQARGFTRIPQRGEYYLEVSSLFGKGSPDSTYTLRVSRGRTGAERGDDSAAEWRERSFSRTLAAAWIGVLRARSVEAPQASPAARASSGAASSAAPAVAPESAGASGRLGEVIAAREKEPNDLAGEALEVSAPTLIEGAIERPGDVDSFRFRAEAGQKLAFEIETPATGPPHFNPRLAVIDAQDRQVFSSVHRRISYFNNNSEQEVFLKAVEPKAVHTFTAAGEYLLQIRDITSRYGEPGYRYKILVRPQIPHVGEIPGMDLDRINLVRGKTRKLMLTALHEEGFAGEAAFEFSGLPPGVSALPVAQPAEERAPTEVTENPETVAPKRHQSAIVLLAGAGAALSTAPALVRLECRPIVNGAPGEKILVREIPVMVVEK